MAAAINGMEDIIRDFLIESAEGVDLLDRNLVALEREPASRELLAEIFRAVHTLKGNSGVLGYPKLESVAHAGENLLTRLREGELELSPELTNGLLAMVDALRGLLNAVEETGNEADGDYGSVVSLLRGLGESSAAAQETDEKVEAREETADSSGLKRVGENCAVPKGTQLNFALHPGLTPGAKTNAVAAGLNSAAEKLEKQVPHRLKSVRDDRNKGAYNGATEDAPLQNRPHSSFSENYGGTPLQIANAVAGFGVAPENLPYAAGPSARSIRVAVGLLDRMMNLVGELVLARNQVLHSAAGFSDFSLTKAVQRLKSVTTGLQESVMKARMQPIGCVWNKLPRLVRDMAAQCGKQAVIEMKGSEIELDRTILEAIKDPLTHILRNAIDHGIELPEDRRRAGKAAAGQVRLRAFHEGGRVHVEISDDGAGINLPRVRQRAVDRGLITSEQAAGMGEGELSRLVFTPGFSTAEAVTNISGRGVGLDVVRHNIERIGGIVDVQSVAGQGTTLKINLPLTLAILPALIVGSGRERFAIPQASLLEVVRLELEHGPNPFEQIYGAPVFRLRDRLLPLVFLDCALGLPQQNAGVVYVVVAQAGARQFGLVVDTIRDTEEIVVKPLSKQLNGLACFSGATILGDGQVVLILDVVGVAQQANLATGLPAQGRTEPAGTETSPTSARQSWVTFRGATGTRFAVPMSAVVRLEEIPAGMVERSQGREVVQYSGKILPLLRVCELIHETSPERGVLQVLVLCDGDKNVGLVVDRIEDIVEEAVELGNGGQTGLLQGPAVIRERVADVLDVKRVLALVGEPVLRAAVGSR
jgi:two-component system chemotaxis sensor kinase CheA